MGVVQLQLRCPQNVGGVAIDPQPDWSFDTLLSELDMIEKKIAASSSFPLPFAKRESREASSAVCGERRAFVMRIDDMDDVEENEDEDEAHEQALVVGKKFACDDYDISENDSSEDELSETEDRLMEKEEVAEGALSELTREHVFSITEEIRNKVVALETDLISDNKKLTSALAQAQKHTEARREMDRKLDMQYQRRIAEALDNHLTDVQRSHEHKSQIEERKIRDDAAIEETKRRDKALQEEKLRQEKVRVETEARVAAERRRAEEAEAERKAAKEAAEKIARHDLAKPAMETMMPARATIISRDSGTVGGVEAQQGGDVVKCAAKALQSEGTRLQIEKKVAAENEALGLGSNSAYDSYKRKITKIIRQTTGIKEGVRTKIDQLSQIFSNPSLPQSIAISMFADSVVNAASSKSAPFAIAHIVVAVASKVPLAMDVLLAKLNKACIFTVPKYISYSKTVFDTEAAHKKAIGYEDEEDEASYLERMELSMKFYGALVQTEVAGAQNKHGLGEGWFWLAWFLNSLPANVYTATALHAFLETAGYALFRRYKSQFKKLLNIVDQHFLVALRKQGNDAKRTRIAAEIETYITTKIYLKEPEGRSFVNSTDSSKAFLEPEYAEQSYHHQQPYRGQSRNYQSFGSHYY